MWYVWLIVALVVATLIAVPFIYLFYKRNYWRYQHVPHESPPPLLDVIRQLFGCTQRLDWEQQEHFQQLYHQYKGRGPFCGFYRLLQPRALILDRELIMQVLIKNFSNFNDRGIYHNSAEDPLSADLFSRRGSEWQEMRVRLEPIFSRDQMPSLFDSVYDACQQWLDDFEQLVQEQQLHGGYIEMRTQMRRYVLHSLALCVFDLNAERQQKHSLSEFADMTHLAQTTKRHSDFVNAILRRYPHLGQRFKVCTTTPTVEAYFLQLIAEVVAEREKCEEPKQDYMQLLVDLLTQELSTHETAEERSMKELKEHLMEELAAHAFTFLRAGLRPTTHTLTYVLYELALNEPVQQQLRDEIEEALQRHNNKLNYECVHELEYMGQVISETLRMHPIVPFLVRRTLADYPVPSNPDHVLRKDMFVIIPTHAIHNDSAYYPEPYIFRPERFAKYENKTREQCIWLGFGEGARSCIGLRYAQLQMRILLAQLLVRYRFEVDRTRLMVKQQNVISLRVDPLGAEPEGREAAAVI